jgi:hypothetical protein
LLPPSMCPNHLVSGRHMFLSRNRRLILRSFSVSYIFSVRGQTFVIIPF